jgi:AhpD family alkylhydroperoxidase
MYLFSQASVYKIREEILPMKLDERILRLIAIGASISAHCQPCLEVNVKKALENGADEQEIAEAIEVGKLVSKNAAARMDKFASSLSHVSPSETIAQKSGCGGCES